MQRAIASEMDVLMTEAGATLFLDFDGTITRRDATDAILEAFADPAWLEIERAWLAGHIGSRECLRAQMALVSAQAAEVDALLDGIEVDPGLETLFDTCAVRGIPLHIISDGFDYCIRRILSRPDRGLLPRLASSQIVSSGLAPGQREGHWRTTFAHPQEPCEHDCATCKPAAMKRLAAGDVMVFIGDGLSDQHAAALADIVFAKDKLRSFCESAGIPYTPYETLDDVGRAVERMLPTPARVSGPSATRSRKVVPTA